MSQAQIRILTVDDHRSCERGSLDSSRRRLGQQQGADGALATPRCKAKCHFQIS
jgi:hypothetical protein